MPNSTSAELNRLRLWRTWLLIVVGAGQGIQYLAAPDRPLTTPGYALLRPLGDTGWRTVGLLLLIYAALLVTQATRPAGHIVGAALYLGLMWATALHGYWPSLSILAAGLNCGEFGFRLRHRGRG